MQRNAVSSPQKFLTKLHKKTAQKESKTTGEIYQAAFNLLEKAIDKKQKTLDLSRVLVARDPKTSTLDYIAICTRILGDSTLQFLFLDETHITLISAQKLIFALNHSSIILVSMGGCVFEDGAAEALAEWHRGVQQKVTIDVMTLALFDNLQKKLRMAELERKFEDCERDLLPLKEQKTLPKIPDSKKLTQQPATVFGPTIQGKLTNHEKNEPISPAYRFRRRRGA